MKTVTEKYYICEICGKSSKNEQKIKECQESHRSITDDCQIEQVYQNGKILPRLLNITFPDGEKAQFYNNDPRYR